MDQKVLEIALKRSIKDQAIARVIEAESESALPKGENYLSTILRIRMKVVLGNGRVTMRNLIVKRGDGSDNVAVLMNEAFKVELKMYSSIFRQMEYLIEDVGDYEEPLWCKFIHYDSKSSSLILEDLKAAGFSLVQRQVGIDMEHGQLALRSLARYHAIGKVLEERGIISKDDFDTHPLMTNSRYVQTLSYSGLKTLRLAMVQHWGPEWASLASKLDIPSDVFYEKVKSCSVYTDEEFVCLNHGDCWTNNIMFKYNWQGKPHSLRFVDFQFSNYNTPCADVSNFLYMSLQPKLRRKNYKLFLEYYFEALIKYLDIYGFKGTRPTLKGLEAAMERVSFFGICLFVCWYASLTAKEGTATFDLDTLLKTSGSEGFHSDMYLEDGIIEKLGDDLIDFVEKYFSS
ncbi:unnamed protein product [Nezara viridula]|uniref:CHK kinase-like domain-containing protein n=1 Tax=Nezara viridula TaxID=85310 RepID=A0A9P0E8X2_NEZVI|nr:unnamed protein product [Nezara viridula]